MSENKRFHGIVNFNKAGELVCFCSYDEYLQGKCVCRTDLDCPEAMIEITVLPNSRPSDEIVTTIRKAAKAVKNVNKSMNSIKAGVRRLEKSLKGSKYKV